MAENARKRSRSKAQEKPQTELGQVLAAVAKRYGDTQIIKASSTKQPPRISTGVFILDFALLGGIPHNRQSMFIGERHSGKSMMACLVIASAQFYYPDQVCVLLDLEGTFDKVWAAKLGVDLDRLLIVEPDTGEMAVDLAESLIATKEISLMAMDSIAALTPMAEIDAEAGDAMVGVQARLIGRMIRKLTNGLIKERKRGHYVTTLYLNQFRSKIGGFQSFGEPRSIPGGKALEFSTTVQCILKNKEHAGRDDSEVEMIDYNEHSYTITKNKLNNGPRTGEFRLVRKNRPSEHLSVGDIDDGRTMVTYAKKLGFYTGAGKGQKLVLPDRKPITFGNQDKAILTLNEDGDLAWALRCALIRQQAHNLGMPAEFIETVV